MFFDQPLYHLRENLLLPGMGAPTQQNDLPIFPSCRFSQLTAFSRMIRRQSRNVILHASHQMKSLLRKSCDREPTHVLRTLHSNPVKQLKDRPNKSPRQTKQPAISSRQPRIHKKNLHPHLPCPPQHVWPYLVLHQNQHGRPNSTKSPQHRVIKISRHINQAGFFIQQVFPHPATCRCSRRQQDS